MTSTHDTTTFGSRLLPHLVDERAKNGYARPFAMYPNSKDASLGFQSISYARISNAVNRVSFWLDVELSGKDLKDNPFAYFGPNDLRYFIFVLAVMKTGRKILIASPRNPINAQQSLFSKVNCKAIVLCSSIESNFQPLITASGLHHIQAPRLDDLLSEDPVPNYAYHESYESAPDTRFLIMHTSGTSGNPKPVSVGKHWIGALDTPNCLPLEQGPSLAMSSLPGSSLLDLLPCFHAGGLAVNMTAAFIEITLVLGHPDVPISAQYVAQLLKLRVITAMVSPPSILEELSKDMSALQDLARLKHIGYGGGPLRPGVGNKLISIVPHLFSFIGATEEGWFHIMLGSNAVWDSLRFYTDIGYGFDEVSDGIFEFVIVNDERTNKFHGVFEVFPELREYRTKDLYSRNSNHPGWWKYKGRADDLIVLSNGEKINPIPMENIVGSHPSVRSALIIGEYRFSASLLVELETGALPKTEEDRHKCLNDIWPCIQEANQIAAGFAKIPKSLVLFASPKKAFLRAGKGTVQRQLTVKAYAKELDHLYSSQEDGLLTEGLAVRKSSTPDDIKIFTREIYKQALDDENLGDDDDVFQRGMDSLRVSVVVRRLKAALKASEISLNFEDVSTRMVYKASSVEKMTNGIIRLIDKNSDVPHANGVSSNDRQQTIESMLEKHSRNLPATGAKTAAASSARPWSVIITGTTGSLGTHLLATLERMSKSQVAKIICLNRSVNAKEKQQKLDLARGIKAAWHEANDQRVEFLQADFSKPDFGLGQQTYSKLLHQTTVIIHSAWQVNFNLSLESFEPQIRGVRNLLDFGSQCANKAPVVFVSSISTVFQWMENHPTEKVPEAVISDFDAPERLGYGESKFVSEHLLEKVSKASGLTTAIFRTGQIAGPVTDTGVWNKQEWLPSIIASSKYLGVLPETLGGMQSVDWVPVDFLSRIMVELVEELLRRKEGTTRGTQVYNLVNPQTTSWASLLPAVQEYTGIPKIISLKDWVEALEQSSREKNGAVIEANPGVKLLDFYRGLSEKETAGQASRYNVESLVRDSKQASNMVAVSPHWVENWLRQWNF